MNCKYLETNLGIVEHITFGTDGPYIFVLHGAPGGVDQIIPYMSRLIDKYKCRVVAISRPGYGGTTLDNLNNSFEDQADLVLSVMDHLKIDKVTIYGISAGGAVAIHFAAKYKNRCNGLILESSVGYRYKMGSRSILGRTLNASLFTEIGSKINKFIAKRLPRLGIYLLLNKVGNLSRLEMVDAINDIMNNKKKLTVFRQIVYSFSTIELRLKGLHNDLHHLEHNARYPLSDVSVPTLVIHGTRDADLSIEHADYIVDSVKQAVLLEIYNGTHILPLSNRTRMINNVVVDFLQNNG